MTPMTWDQSTPRLIWALERSRRKTHAGSIRVVPRFRCSPTRSCCQGVGLHERDRKMKVRKHRLWWPSLIGGVILAVVAADGSEAGWVTSGVSTSVEPSAESAPSQAIVVGYHASHPDHCRLLHQHGSRVHGRGRVARSRRRNVDKCAIDPLHRGGATQHCRGIHSPGCRLLVDLAGRI